MEILNSRNLKWDKRFVISVLLTIILAIVLGVVLYKTSYISIYIYNFADKYVLYVFTFKSGSLFIGRFLAELFFFYITFLIVYFFKIKYFTLPIFFLRTLFAVFYSIVLFGAFTLEGVFAALLVFIPMLFLSLFTTLFICEQYAIFCKPYNIILPCALSLLCAFAQLILVNVVLRFVVVIV